MSWVSGATILSYLSFHLSPVRIEIQGLEISYLLDKIVNFHLLWQRAFSPEGLSEMWNEMVIDEEITFNREESAHTGTALHLKNWTYMENSIKSQILLLFFFLFFKQRIAQIVLELRKRMNPMTKKRKKTRVC